MSHRVSTILALCLLLVLPAFGDVEIQKKSTNEPGGMPGASPSEQTSTSWIGKGKFAELGNGGRVVILGEQKKLLMVDDSAKTYNSLDLPIDFAKLAPGMEQMMEQMAAQLQLKIDVVPTDEAREINGFPTKKSVVKVSSAMGVTGEINVWLTDKIDIDVAAWRSLTQEMGALAPPGIGDVFKAVAKLEGFPILQEIHMSMMGQSIKSTEEVVSVERKDAPAGVYEIPAGYTEKPFDPMAALGGR